MADLSLKAIDNPGAHHQEYEAAGWTVEDALRMAQASLGVAHTDLSPRAVRQIWRARVYISLGLKLVRPLPTEEETRP